jgi:hypothetical protein
MAAPGPLEFDPTVKLLLNKLTHFYSSIVVSRFEPLNGTSVAARKGNFGSRGFARWDICFVHENRFFEAKSRIFPESPRLSFSLCLPLLSGYVFDSRTVTGFGFRSSGLFSGKQLLQLRADSRVNSSFMSGLRKRRRGKDAVFSCQRVSFQLSKIGSGVAF